jgi:hypothetical protein
MVETRMDLMALPEIKCWTAGTQRWRIVDDLSRRVECRLLAALRPTTVPDDHLGCARYAKDITRPSGDLQLSRQRTFMQILGRAS